MLSLLSIVALGFFLGMRHATDPDHVIAVIPMVAGTARRRWLFLCSGCRRRSGRTLLKLLSKIG